MASLLMIVVAALWAAGCTRTAFRDRRAPVRWIAGLTAFTAALLVPVHVAGMLEILGALDRVTPGRFLVLQLGLLAPTWLLVLGRRGGGPGEGAPAAPWWTLRGASFPIRAAALVVAGTYVVFGLEAATSYPVGWDALRYHLPVALHWLQSESLAIPQPWAHWHYALPANAETLMLFGLDSGWEPSVVLPSLLGLAAAVAGLLVVAPFLGGAGEVGVAAALLLAATPIFLFQAFTPYVDLFGTGFLVAGLAVATSSLLDRARSRDARTWALVGAAWGIAVGTKPTFWVFAFLAYLLVVAARIRRGNGWTTAALLIPLGVLALGGFWFLRAVEATGNPFHPLAIGIGGLELLPGFDLAAITSAGEDRFRGAWETLVYPWHEEKDAGYPFSPGSGLGAAFAAFVPLGILYAVCRLRGRPRPPGLAPALLALFLFAVVWWTGFGRDLRFGLPLVWLAVVAAVPLLRRLLPTSTGARRLFLGATAVTCVLAAFPRVHALVGRIRVGEWARHEVYGYPPALDSLPPGSVVLNRDHSAIFNYPLAGRRLENRIVPAEWVGTLPLEEALDRFDVDVIVDEAPFQRPPPPADRTTLWLAGDPPGVSGPPWRVWKVLPSAGEAPGDRSATAGGRRRPPAAPRP